MHNFENRDYFFGARERGQVLHISVLVMNRLNTTESAIFIYLVYSLLPKESNYSELI